MNTKTSLYGVKARTPEYQRRYHADHAVERSNYNRQYHLKHRAERLLYMRNHYRIEKIRAIYNA